jgi:REP element-mobilizing transposase RayT
LPRRARLAVAGIPWHIIQRGNNRVACFYCEADYCRYLQDLAEQAARHGCQVHAYCLMTNHVHLFVTPERQDSAGLMMEHLGQRYVQYISRVYLRSGTLWEGRFRSCLTQSEEYVLAWWSTPLTIPGQAIAATARVWQVPCCVRIRSTVHWAGPKMTAAGATESCSTHTWSRS